MDELVIPSSSSSLPGYHRTETVMEQMFPKSPTPGGETKAGFFRKTNTGVKKERRSFFGRVKGLFAFTQWIGSYNKKTAIADMVAGLTIGIIMIPQV